jgi:hypothetical protein
MMRLVETSRNILEVYGPLESDDDKTKYYITADLGFFPAKVKLPDGLVCDHCVIQVTVVLNFFQ